MFSKCKISEVIVFLGMILCSCTGAPQYYMRDIVKQAHTMQLLPQEAVVDKTAPGIQAAYYHIRPFEKINLNSALGSSIPLDVIQSLENQVDAIGGHYPFYGQQQSQNQMNSYHHQPRTPYH